MIEILKRVILAYKRSFSKKLKKRSAIDRYKSRQYYRKNKTKIKLHRKQYLKRNKTYRKSRKLFKRTRPSWMSNKTRAKSYKPKTHKPKTFKAPKSRKVYAPKRTFTKKN